MVRTGKTKARTIGRIFCDFSEPPHRKTIKGKPNGGRGVRGAGGLSERDKGKERNFEKITHTPQPRQGRFF